MKKVIKVIISIILISVLFISTSFILCLLPIKKAISGNAIKEIISNLEIEKLVEEDPNFEKAIYDVLEPVFTETQKLNIDDEVIIKILDSEQVKNIVGNATGNFMDYIITGVDKKLITTENIEDLLNKAMDDINDSEYYEISEQQRNKILKVVEDQVYEYDDLIPNTSSIENNFTQEDINKLNEIRYYFKQPIIYFSLAIVLSILGLIFIYHKKAKFIKYSSITILISSIFISLIDLVLLLINKFTLYKEIPYVYIFVNNIIKYIFTVSITITVMIIILILYIIIKKRSKLTN